MDAFPVISRACQLGTNANGDAVVGIAVAACSKLLQRRKKRSVSDDPTSPYADSPIRTTYTEKPAQISSSAPWSHLGTQYCNGQLDVLDMPAFIRKYPRFLFTEGGRKYLESLDDPEEVREAMELMAKYRIQRSDAATTAPRSLEKSPVDCHGRRNKKSVVPAELDNEFFRRLVQEAVEEREKGEENDHDACFNGDLSEPQEVYDEEVHSPILVQKA